MPSAAQVRRSAGRRRSFPGGRVPFFSRGWRRLRRQRRSVASDVKPVSGGVQPCHATLTGDHGPRPILCHAIILSPASAPPGPCPAPRQVTQSQESSSAERKSSHTRAAGELDEKGGGKMRTENGRRSALSMFCLSWYNVGVYLTDAVTVSKAQGETAWAVKVICTFCIWTKNRIAYLVPVCCVSSAGADDFKGMETNCS